jgi:hypothetical protein
VVIFKWPLQKVLNKVKREYVPNYISYPSQKEVDDGIESYHVVMGRYFTKAFRMLQYKSLNKFYKEARRRNSGRTIAWRILNIEFPSLPQNKQRKYERLIRESMAKLKKESNKALYRQLKEYFPNGYFQQVA